MITPQPGLRGIEFSLVGSVLPDELNLLVQFTLTRSKVAVLSTALLLWLVTARPT